MGHLQLPHDDLGAPHSTLAKLTMATPFRLTMVTLTRQTIFLLVRLFLSAFIILTHMSTHGVYTCFHYSKHTSTGFYTLLDVTSTSIFGEGTRTAHTLPFTECVPHTSCSLQYLHGDTATVIWEPIWWTQQ